MWPLILVLACEPSPPTDALVMPAPVRDIGSGAAAAGFTERGDPLVAWVDGGKLQVRLIDRDFSRARPARTLDDADAADPAVTSTRGGAWVVWRDGGVLTWRPVDGLGVPAGPAVSTPHRPDGPLTAARIGARVLVASPNALHVLPDGPHRSHPVAALAAVPGGDEAVIAWLDGTLRVARVGADLIPGPATDLGPATGPVHLAATPDAVYVAWTTPEGDGRRTTLPDGPPQDAPVALALAAGGGRTITVDAGDSGPHLRRDAHTVTLPLGSRDPQIVLRPGSGQGYALWTLADGRIQGARVVSADPVNDAPKRPSAP